MSEKFTPGPWKVSGVRIIGALGTLEQESVARITWLVYPPEDEAEEMEVANAHLIAASPEGFALAEMVMDYCGDPKGISDARRDELYDAALQFTKKARGES